MHVVTIQSYSIDIRPIRFFSLSRSVHKHTHGAGILGSLRSSDELAATVAEPFRELRRWWIDQWRAGIGLGTNLLAARSTLPLLCSQLLFFVIVHVAVNHQFNFAARARKTNDTYCVCYFRSHFNYPTVGALHLHSGSCFCHRLLKLVMFSRVLRDTSGVLHRWDSFPTIFRFHRDAVACRRRRDKRKRSPHLVARYCLKQSRWIDLPEDRFIGCARMPSYALAPVASASLRTYWSASGDVDARTPQDQGPLSFGHHHQLLDHDTMSSGMSGNLAASQQRHHIVALACTDRQLNCTTPRKSPNSFCRD